jgi:hypothetical protein
MSSSNSFSGITSNLSHTWPTGLRDILSKVILTPPSSGSTGNFAHFVIGNLLIQFGTGISAGGSTIVLPIPYDAATTGWSNPYTIFVSSKSNSLSHWSDQTESQFVMHQKDGDFANWMTIGPLPAAYAGQ